MLDMWAGKGFHRNGIIQSSDNKAFTFSPANLAEHHYLLADADKCKCSTGREQAADCALLLALMHLSYHLVLEVKGSLYVDRTVFLLSEQGCFLHTG